MKELLIKSTIDQTEQPSLFYFAGDGRPLLVGLHTWSAERSNQISNMLPVAEKLGWSLLLPEFRGPNMASNPSCRDACGALPAKQDIIDAVDYVVKHYGIDDTRIFLLGASGGGHMTLMMSAYSPGKWRAAAAFVPLTDLKQWFYEKNAENSKYALDIAACCGGPPGDDNIGEYEARSPITYAEEIGKANLKIFHGKYDKSIPFTHSVNLYNEILKRSPGSRTFLEIFDGGHEMRMDDAVRWFCSQINDNDTAADVTG